MSLGVLCDLCGEYFVSHDDRRTRSYWEKQKLGKQKADPPSPSYGGQEFGMAID
jgi:hypothetical protein